MTVEGMNSLLSISHHEILNRARGAFIGLAVGDAFGASVEFMTAGEIKEKFGVLTDIAGGGWLRLKAGAITDDTEMALCIARALVAAKGWSLVGIADNFAGWLKSKPVDIGSTCRRGIRNYMLHGRLQAKFNQWDAGNGAVMRMLPVALFTLGDKLLLDNCAVEQARITHNHPLADAACVWFGRLMHLALCGAGKPALRKELEGLFALHENFRFDHYNGLATAYVVDTMQTVFHYFFRSRSFEECLINTVNQGGDADTTGAIAGALAGAYYGIESIPRRWLQKMDKKVIAEISDLAPKLVGLSPLVKSYT